MNPGCSASWSSVLGLVACNSWTHSSTLTDSISDEQSNVTTSELSSSNNIPVILLASSGCNEQVAHLLSTKARSLCYGWKICVNKKTYEIWILERGLPDASQQVDRACSQASFFVPRVEQKPNSC